MSRWPADRACGELVRALDPHLGSFTLRATTSRDWASALFFGARHRLALTLEGEDAATRAEALCAALPEMVLDLRGGFVADCQATVTRVDDRVVLGIEALTIEEAETSGLRGELSCGVRRAG